MSTLGIFGICDTLQDQILFYYCQSNLLLRHGEAEVCNDGLKLDSHCRLDLGPREHLRGIERLKEEPICYRSSESRLRYGGNSAVYRVACLRHEDQVLLQHLRVNYIYLMQFQSRITVHLDQSNLREIVLRLLLKGVELHQDMFRILHVGPNLSSFLYCQDPCGIFP